ncbi:hypothetical protein K469DRAFT_744532 [Zopfia rhizophila CBS 207.26]|uniref:Uncharacterized protein n=1 Tax=Zopfia rhizophila CBS 207.26 TaxID=1314779 RepID=A0A6A6EXN7_9PEZI|nr:hypothetical protein K469DRAFT_744532 [Zopfia rhizophila CBS 207.26]
MHTTSVLLVSALAFLSVSATPTEAIFGRHVGDKCKDCPNDPDDIQCCVEISCKNNAGYCRSVSHNGCPGGSFDSGNWCPGDNDIQCCIKATGTPPPAAAAAGNLPGLKEVQSNHARTIISRVHALGMPKRACLVAIATAQQESGIRVLANSNIKASYNYPHDGDGHDHDSVGIFQQRPGWGTIEDRMDPAKSADKFLNRLKSVKNWANLSIAQAAQKVQVSAYPDAYAKWERLATNVCNAAF